MTTTSLEVGGAKEADDEDREVGAESKDEVDVLEIVGKIVVGADICLCTRKGY